MNKVASYKKEAKLETDKKVNIIYGLNGTGKTTISDFLYNKTDQKFSDCSVKKSTDELLLVYNSSFIQDNFYEKPNQDGIFTLSKENKEAEEKIKKAGEEISRLEIKKMEKTEQLNFFSKEHSEKKKKAEDKAWEIKDKFAGGDRVLEYCLDGLKGKKETLFNYLQEIEKPDALPKETIEDLKKEVSLLNDNTANKYDLLPKILFDFGKIENDDVFHKVIIGNENSIVSGLIKKLNNADWVKNGLKYLAGENITDEYASECPFCQQKTITREIYTNIIAYFDEEYEKEINKVRNFLSEYIKETSNISKEPYESNLFINEAKAEFEKLFDAVKNFLNKNIKVIQYKMNSPSQNYTVENSNITLLSFNTFIDNSNKRIADHNTKIENKQQSLNEIKNIFWKIMRYNYDVTIADFLNHEADMQKSLNEITVEIQKLDSEINSQRRVIETEQRKTVNIDEAIENINGNLSELGMDGFRIYKYSETFYKIIRDNSNENTFKTLSEGEKMIISFLYFVELCKGKRTISETINKKIIVIDDPISSLSHIYVFNIGEMIKREFCNSSQYEQIFILTHSLYFFYEMTDINHDRRKQTQKLFRIVKNSGGSYISEMKYEEVQNDYQSYWSIINNPDNPPAILANCIRNVVEYFFGFIEKMDLAILFQKKELQDIRFKAFYRYINRESHSLGQNIFDYKEFNYDNFREALKLLFYENGYKEHYDKMVKIVW
jgi:wobble nucleotide-excising tRNase